MQMTLYAPDITCDHCLDTIETVSGTVPGISFLRGDPNAREFAVEVERGAALDELAVALQAEGYPLGPAPELPGAGAARLTLEGATGGPTAADAPYAVERTEAGARIETDCPCGCRMGFDLDRSVAQAEAAGCCCGRALLVSPQAGEQLRAERPDDRVDVTDLTMPWGQPMQAALARPREG